MSLTLPLIYGKKYVSRAGTVVTIGGRIAGGAVAVQPDDDKRPPYAVRVHDGRVSNFFEQDHDIVADYVAPDALPAGLEAVPEAHPHAPQMLEFAQDAAVHRRPWELWQRRDTYGKTWADCDSTPLWDVNTLYRRKPRVIVINGHEVPEPLRVAPAEGAQVFYPRFDMSDLVGSFQWRNYFDNQNLLARGACHLSREAAEAHAKALLSFTEVK